MTLWFSASAVIPQLNEEWNLSPAQRSWMTMSVQIGFVVGALGSGFLNIADRFPIRHVLVVSTFWGAAFNLIIAFFSKSVEFTLFLRFLTGLALSGVYPPGMKLMATWCQKDRGLCIGVLVGSITIGSAFPHLLNAFPLFGEDGMPPWRIVLVSTSAQAVVGALITLFFVQPGPLLPKSAPLNWRFAAEGLLYRPTRLANFGYLGHMWELYAMWSWTPLFLILSYKDSGWSLQLARIAGFGVIAIGAVGSLLAGILADRIGRTTVTVWSLVVSGICAIISGFLFDFPLILTFVCLIWGFAVVADSAQFSTAITELADQRYVGTALTIQTSLGFLLTLITIHLIPLLVESIGWKWSFSILALGPIAGIWSIRILRKLPEANKMASGHK